MQSIGGSLTRRYFDDVFGLAPGLLFLGYDLCVFQGDY